MFTINLQGKNAFVCGASSGIGKAIAFELAYCGANVTILSRSPEQLQIVKDALPNEFRQNHNFVAADLSNIDKLSQIIKDFVAANPEQNILVNNSAGPDPGPITEAKPSAFEKTFSMHLLANQILVQHFLPGMKKSGFGRIVNIISSSVKQPIPNLGVSNTIRGAVANWAKTLAGELGGSGITVNNILPGATNTERLEQLINEKAKRINKSKAEIESEMLKEIPLKRFADAREIAYAALFLVSPQAAYITGTNLIVDGGRCSSL